MRDAGSISLHLSLSVCGCMVLELGWESIVSPRTWALPLLPVLELVLAAGPWLQIGVETPHPEA